MLFHLYLVVIRFPLFVVLIGIVVDIDRFGLGGGYTAHRCESTVTPTSYWTCMTPVTAAFTVHVVVRLDVELGSALIRWGCE